MPEQFEPGEKGQEKPGEAGEAVAEADGQGPEESVVEPGLEEEMTEERIEARFQERMSRLEALKKEVAAEYGWDFSSLKSGVEHAEVGLGKEPLFRDPKLIALIKGIELKEKEIHDEKESSLKALAEKRRGDLGEKLGGI